MRSNNKFCVRSQTLKDESVFFMMVYITTSRVENMNELWCYIRESHLNGREGTKSPGKIIQLVDALIQFN